MALRIYSEGKGGRWGRGTLAFGRARVSGVRGRPGFTVSIGSREVERFMGRWPASGLRGLRSVRAGFDRNGDLVDLDCNMRRAAPGAFDTFGPCEAYDGPALNALVADMQCIGEKRLKIKDGRCASDEYKNILGRKP